MRSTLLAAALLVLAAPALAATAHPSMRATILRFEKLYGECIYGKADAETCATNATVDAETCAAVVKTCAAAYKLEEKLEARGYCIYGHGVVGRAGRKYFYPGIDSAGTNSHMARHCYKIRQ